MSGTTSRPVRTRNQGHMHLFHCVTQMDRSVERRKEGQSSRNKASLHSSNRDFLHKRIYRSQTNHLFGTILIPYPFPPAGQERRGRRPPVPPPGPGHRVVARCRAGAVQPPDGRGGEGVLGRSALLVHAAEVLRNPNLVQVKVEAWKREIRDGQSRIWQL